MLPANYVPVAGIRPVVHDAAMRDRAPGDVFPGGEGGFRCFSTPPDGPEVEIRGALAVLRQADRFLLIRRARGVRLGGLWCFPGGTIEPHESESDALVREIREELGLLVRPEHRLMVMSKRGGKLLLHWWSATIVGGALAPNPAEVADARWMTPAEIRAWPQTECVPPPGSSPHLIVGSVAILDWLGV